MARHLEQKKVAGANTSMLEAAELASRQPLDQLAEGHSNETTKSLE